MMVKTTDELIAAIQEVELHWMVSRKDPCFFDVVFEGEHVELRLNDFPDEPLVTLFIRDREVNLEERPRVWHPISDHGLK